MAPICLNSVSPRPICPAAAAEGLISISNEGSLLESSGDTSGMSRMSYIERRGQVPGLEDAAVGFVSVAELDIVEKTRRVVIV